VAPAPRPLLERELLVVTGKGGVGKTTVAAGMALLAARQGKRVLVCEVDAKGTLAEALEAPPLAFVAQPVDVAVPAPGGVWAMAMDTEESLREYLGIHLRVPIVARIGPLARTLDFVASAAPGVKEILTIGKLAYEVRERHYDLVVVDAAATGHIVGQLAAPQAINDLVQVGLVREQTRWMLDILADPARTGLVIVTTPEEMPVDETIDLAGRVGRETPVQLAAVVVNRVLPELFGRGEEEAFGHLRSGEALRALEDLAGPGAATVLDAAELAVTLRRSGAAHLAELQTALPPGVGTVFVPEMFARLRGTRATSMVADALGEELG
jgi:anion-transporting  ArsA/GET3 family ATPase